MTRFFTVHMMMVNYEWNVTHDDDDDDVICFYTDVYCTSTSLDVTLRNGGHILSLDGTRESYRASSVLAHGGHLYTNHEWPWTMNEPGFFFSFFLSFFLIFSTEVGGRWRTAAFRAAIRDDDDAAAAQRSFTTMRQVWRTLPGLCAPLLAVSPIDFFRSFRIKSVSKTTILIDL